MLPPPLATTIFPNLHQGNRSGRILNSLPARSFEIRGDDREGRLWGAATGCWGLSLELLAERWSQGIKPSSCPCLLPCISLFPVLAPVSCGPGPLLQQNLWPGQPATQPCSPLPPGNHMAHLPLPHRWGALRRGLPLSTSATHTDRSAAQTKMGPIRSLM